MGASPVPVLIIIGIYVACFALIVGTTQSYGLDEEPEFEEPQGGIFGFLDALLNVVQTVWEVVLLILGALVFNVDGAPVFIRLPISIAIIGSLTWSIATLIRGN